MISVRRLPHLYPQDRWLFLTWHLHGSIRPYHFPPPHKASAGQAFVWLDRQLDTAPTWPLFLHKEPIASLVVESLHRGAALGHYELSCFVVMANHVHVLLLPKISPSRLMKSLIRLHGSGSESPARQYRRAVLATGNVRSLGKGRAGVESNCVLYREQSGEGGTGFPGRRVSLVVRVGPRERHAGHRPLADSDDVAHALVRALVRAARSCRRPVPTDCPHPTKVSRGV